MNIFKPEVTRSEAWAAVMLLTTLLIFIYVQRRSPESIDFGALSIVLWAASLFSFSLFVFYKRTLERFVFIDEYPYDIQFFEKGDQIILFSLQIACFGFVLGYSINIFGYFIQKSILESMILACESSKNSGFDFWLGSSVCSGILANGPLNSIGVFTLLVGIPGYLALKFVPPFVCAKYISKNVFSNPYLCMILVGVLFQIFSILMENERTFLGILYFLSDMDKAWLIDRVQDLENNIEGKKDPVELTRGMRIVVAISTVVFYAFFTVTGLAFLYFLRLTGVDRLKIERAARLITPENYKISTNFLMLKAGIADGTRIVVRSPPTVNKKDFEDG